MNESKLQLLHNQRQLCTQTHTRKCKKLCTTRHNTEPRIRFHKQLGSPDQQPSVTINKQPSNMPPAAQSPADWQLRTQSRLNGGTRSLASRSYRVSCSSSSSSSTLIVVCTALCQQWWSGLEGRQTAWLTPRYGGGGSSTANHRGPHATANDDSMTMRWLTS